MTPADRAAARLLATILVALSALGLAVLGTLSLGPTGELALLILTGAAGTVALVALNARRDRGDDRP